MKNLNEKLASVCGLTPFDKSKCPGCGLSADRQKCAFDQGSDCPRLNMPDYLDDRGREVPRWNPAGDNLSQLLKCYRTLSLEQKATYKQLIIDHEVQSVFDVPDQHAELILKAKGAEV